MAVLQAVVDADGYPTSRPVTMTAVFRLGQFITELFTGPHFCPQSCDHGISPILPCLSYSGAGKGPGRETDP